MSETGSSPAKIPPGDSPPAESADPLGDDLLLPHGEGFVLDTQGDLDYEELLEDPLEGDQDLEDGDELLGDGGGPPEGSEDLLESGEDPLASAAEDSGGPLDADGDPVKDTEAPQAVSQVSLHRNELGLRSCNWFILVRARQKPQWMSMRSISTPWKTLRKES